MKLFVGTICVLILCWGCSGKPSAAYYASMFCKCSEDLAKATIQLENKRITQEAFDAIAKTQEQCMGKRDPLKGLSRQDSLAFQITFLEELKKQCPNIARNYGYKMD